MIYRILKKQIEAGRTDGIENKIDVFYAAGKLSDEQYVELTELLSEKTEA